MAYYTLGSNRCVTGARHLFHKERKKSDNEWVILWGKLMCCLFSFLFYFLLVIPFLSCLFVSLYVHGERTDDDFWLWWALVVVVMWCDVMVVVVVGENWHGLFLSNAVKGSITKNIAYFCIHLFTVTTKRNLCHFRWWCLVVWIVDVWRGSPPRWAIL